MVLRAVVATYVAEAMPASSSTVRSLLPVALSSASVRNTMAELSGLGLIEKPHASAGRVPTQQGLREFVDRLLHAPDLGDYDKRTLEVSFADVDSDAIMQLASQLLSDRTQQLGFVMVPRIERMTLRHVSLVRVARDRVLVVLVPQGGAAYQRVIEEKGHGDQAVLERMAAELNERVVGRTLFELRDALIRELDDLRRQASALQERTLSIGLQVLQMAQHQAATDLVLGGRLALLSQPEFNDPEEIRGVFAAIETNERLLEVLSRVLEAPGDSVSISLGEDLAEPGLQRCALVAVPYGAAPGYAARAADEFGEAGGTPGASPLGVLGVIGPNRMDYARIIPLVSYCSQLVTEKLNE